MEKFDYIVPLETLRKNRIKSYKEYCEAQKREKEQEEFNQDVKLALAIVISSFATATLILINFIF